MHGLGGLVLWAQTEGTLCDLIAPGYRRSLFQKVLFRIHGHSKGTLSRQLKETRHRVDDKVFSNIPKQIIQVTPIRMSRTKSFPPVSGAIETAVNFQRHTAADQRLIPRVASRGYP